MSAEDLVLVTLLVVALLEGEEDLGTDGEILSDLDDMIIVLSLSLSR